MLRTAIRAFLVVFLCMIVNSSFAGVRGDWKDARKKDTISAYQEFIKEYPNNKRSALAEERVLEIREEVKGRVMADYESYASAPTARSVDLFIESIATAADTLPSAFDANALVFELAMSADSIDAIEAYLRCCPDSSGTKKASARLQELRWEKTEKLDSSAAYRAYSQTYPHDIDKVDIIQTRVAALEKEEQARAAALEKEKREREAAKTCEDAFEPMVRNLMFTKQSCYPVRRTFQCCMNLEMLAEQATVIPEMCWEPDRLVLSKVGFKSGETVVTLAESKDDLFEYMREFHTAERCDVKNRIYIFE